MKTQKRTLRSIVTSSILTLVLAAGMVPSTAIAFAAENANASQEASQQPIANGEAADAENSNSDSASAPAITSETVKLESSSSENAESGSGEQVSADSAAAMAGETSASAEASGANDSAAIAPQAFQAPAYNSVANGITSADMPLTPIEQQPQTIGSVEYGGIRYTINTDDLTTVAATGLASVKPAGDVQIQSQVAISGTLYPVVSIKNCVGGGSLI